MSASGAATSAKVAAARLSIGSNVTLVVMKLVVGLSTGSVSVLSEAAHSANDLVAAFIAFFSVRVSDRPADQRHPYGHGKVESLSGMAEALLIFGAAGYIIYEAVAKLRAGAPEVAALPGVVAMVVSTIVNIAVSRRLFRVAEATDSLALKADAEHLRTDVITSLGVALGLVLVYVTGWYALDPLVALGVALLICYAAARLAREATEPLLDSRLPESDLERIREVLEQEPNAKAYHKLRTRKSGSFRHVDVHVLVDDSLTLVQAHDLTERLEDKIRAVLPFCEVMIHTEPHEAEIAHQYEEHGGASPPTRAG